ncbi:hypothetical protein SAMN04488577_2298 [Bacillus sp. cl95]|nr:hypothetical protein SAMN02799634_102178 [Bacillus sp. UNCCL13]SFQ83955.1 hypothetical protein SAMN04488577_2298 [Bacillus sp. cl95]
MFVNSYFVYRKRIKKEILKLFSTIGCINKKVNEEEMGLEENFHYAGIYVKVGY